jgi:hypothetical protein
LLLASNNNNRVVVSGDSRGRVVILLHRWRHHRPAVDIVGWMELVMMMHGRRI